MKLLLLFFFVGYATASLSSLVDEAADELISEWLDVAPKRSVAYSEDPDEQSEYEKKLREAFDRIIERVKDALEHGKVVRQDLLDKFENLKQKLKEKKIDLDEKAKDFLKNMKQKVKDYLQKLIDRLGLPDEEKSHSEVQHVDIKGVFQKLKKILLDKIDKEAVKAKIEELFGKGSEMADQLMKMLKEKGEHHKNKLLDFIDRILEDEEEDVDKRSIGDLWDKIKDYFQNLKIDIKEKYAKFGDWVRTKMQDHLDVAKDKITNIKEIAKEFVGKSKEISKEVAVEGLEFLRPYKDDLKGLWEDVKKTVKEVLNKKE